MPDEIDVCPKLFTFGKLKETVRIVQYVTSSQVVCVVSPSGFVSKRTVIIFRVTDGDTEVSQKQHRHFTFFLI
jgi:hypothetical protein